MEKKPFYSEMYKVLALILLAVGFVLGIVFGDSFSVSVPAENDWSEPTKNFNYVVMLITWTCSLGLSLISCVAFSCCKRLELIAENIKKIK